MTLLGILVAVQFVALLGLAVVVLSLARQVGILHERLAPAGMTRSAKNVEPGQALPALSLESISGTPVDLSDGPCAVLFLSADCPICRSVLPAYEPGAAETGRTAYWVADGLPGPDGGLPDYRAYAAHRQLDPDRFLVSRELGMALGVRQLPMLALLDEGRLRRLDGVTGPKQVRQVLLDGAVAQEDGRQRKGRRDGRDG